MHNHSYRILCGKLAHTPRSLSAPSCSPYGICREIGYSQPSSLHVPGLRADLPLGFQAPHPVLCSLASWGRAQGECEEMEQLGRMNWPVNQEAREDVRSSRTEREAGGQRSWWPEG